MFTRQFASIIVAISPSRTAFLGVSAWQLPRSLCCRVPSPSLFRHTTSLLGPVPPLLPPPLPQIPPPRPPHAPARPLFAQLALHGRQPPHGRLLEMQRQRRRHRRVEHIVARRRGGQRDGVREQR